VLINIPRDAGADTVEDSEANLIWQDHFSIANNPKMSWKKAIDYCEDLVFAGSDRWRLPNINELYSITNHSVNKPAIRSAFVSTYVKQDYYWSSTSDVDQTFLAQAVEFESGNTALLQKGGFPMPFDQQVAYVRCVRTK
jgi:hypothetical protein